MAPIRERNGWMVAEGVDSSWNQNTALMASLVATFGGILCLVLAISICGCCGKKEDEKGPQDAKEGGKSSKSAKESPKRMVKVTIAKSGDISDKQDGDALPYQVRTGPAPKHNVPLAPPGHTVPPTYIPDDDDRTVQTNSKKINMSGSKK